MKKSELIFTSLLVPLDFLMLLSAGLSVYFVRTSSFIVQYRPVLFYENLPLNHYLFLIAVISLFLLVVFSLIGLYRIRSKRPLLSDFLKICIGVSAGVIGLVFYSFIQREWFDSRFIILAGWLMAIVLVFFGRLLVYLIQRHLIRKYRIGTTKVLVVGSDKISQKVANNIKQNPGAGYQLTGALEEPDLVAIKKRLNRNGIDEIILANPNWPREKVLRLVNFCNDKNLAFKFVPNLFQALTVNTSMETIGRLPIIELKRTSLDGWGRITKRVVDLVGSFFGIIFLLPIFILIGVIIKLDSKGPIFVRLKRISQGKAFNLYKFRSMVRNAELLKKPLMKKNERQDGPLFKIKDDPRVTRVGRFLRRYRLDELPQLFNVIKGQMGLIGPRPHQPDEIAKYEKRHKKVLAIKSGMTGMAQSSGSSDLSFEEEVKLDTYYIENWSLLLDIKILFKTVLFLIKDRSAC